MSGAQIVAQFEVSGKDNGQRAAAVGVDFHEPLEPTSVLECKSFCSTRSTTGSRPRRIRSRKARSRSSPWVGICNVRPEPKAEAKEKDKVEDALLEAACYRHTLTLRAAQAGIARNWTTTALGLPIP